MQINKIMKLLSDKTYRELILMNHGFYKSMDDESFLKKKFKLIMGKELNLDKPCTFNEKLQWLKIHDHNPIYTDLVDKFEVKKYIANRLGNQYVIPNIGVWNTAEEIDFSKLPNQFVLKCTHNSGLGLCVCKDKSSINIDKVKKGLKRGLKENYYYPGREWPYKNIRPRIIAEEYLEDASGGLVDYKFFCFDGIVDNVMVCIDRHIGHPKFYFFDEHWNLLRLNISGKQASVDFTLPKPKCIDKMFEIASELSKGFPFVRVDLYECNGSIYFGELTFYPDSGFDKNILPETDKYLGDLIKL